MMTTGDLQLTPQGLYCPAGDFHLDPWRPVPRAAISHAHADHARPGCRHYLAAKAGAPLLRTRLGADISLQELEYGEQIRCGSARLSFHPAGHVLGSAQIRIEVAGRVTVFTGDYKVAADPTCAPFEPVPCHVLISESTFGLPIYRWRPAGDVLREVNLWRAKNTAEGLNSVIYSYALGKAQRLLAGFDPDLGPIVLHGAVETVTAAYRDCGIALPATRRLSDWPRGEKLRGVTVIAPPSAAGTPWLRRFEPYSDGMASGWMTVRGTRRRRAIDRGFVLSDHADWPGLLQAINASQPEQVYVTHGYTAELARYLTEQGIPAAILQTLYEGETDTETHTPPETLVDSAQDSPAVVQPIVPDKERPEPVEGPV